MPLPSNAAPMGRQTTPGSANPYMAGGAGILPRRGALAPDALSRAVDLGSHAVARPLYLLRLLRTMHPAMAMADETDLSLLCPPKAIDIVAVRPTEGNAVDDEGTAAIDAFLRALPPEAGGLDGLFATSYMAINYTGLSCMEAVPGRRMEGLSALHTVDSLSIAFGREALDAPLVAYQRQSAGAQPYRRLNPETFRAVAFLGSEDEPYGEARRASALNEVLADIAHTQNLRDAVRHVAWPRIVSIVATKLLFEIATEHLRLSQTEANAQVAAWLSEWQAKFEDLKADDVIFAPEGSSVDILEAGKGFPNLAGITDLFERDMTQALKTLPLFLGINDSTTETQARVQYSVHASALERVRHIALSPIVWAMSLHLRLLGLPLVAEARYERIRTTDALIDAQTEETRIRNAVAKRDEGWQSDEESAIEITGSAPTGERRESPDGIGPGEGDGDGEPD